MFFANQDSPRNQGRVYSDVGFPTQGDFSGQFQYQPFLFISEDNELVRIILVKSGRDAANCWHSLLANEYSADPWTFNEMEKKLTLERFQKEVHLARVITYICVMSTDKLKAAFIIVSKSYSIIKSLKLIKIFKTIFIK